jgi:hypothetical protein
LVFIVVLKVTTLIERILAVVAPHLSSGMPAYVKDLGLTFLNLGSVLALSLVFGNVLLSETRDGPPIFLRSLTSSLGGWLIKRHIQRRLSELVCLYRFTIATGELPPEEEQILTERTEQLLAIIEKRSFLNGLPAEIAVGRMGMDQSRGSGGRRPHLRTVGLCGGAVEVIGAIP